MPLHCTSNTVRYRSAHSTQTQLFTSMQRIHYECIVFDPTGRT